MRDGFEGRTDLSARRRDRVLLEPLSRWVNCWLTPVAILHRCDADGRHIRPISGNIEHDNTPWVLPDGRLLYQRWEYVDRSQVHYHHLWTANPDGTGQMIYHGNLHPGIVMIDAYKTDRAYWRSLWW